jgi:hypothetical protein
MSKRVPRELQVLHRISRTLAKTRDLKEVKSIRDKAEAVRHYARSAALGLEIQNQAAEVKLRAERRGGQLLASIITRGGDRKSNARAESLKLADLGIEHNQSARWQREAAVPEEVFEEYVASAKKSGKDLTTQGLLRLERTLAIRQSARAAGKSARSRVDEQEAPRTPHSSSHLARDRPTTPSEIVYELQNHWKLLTSILKPVFDGQPDPLQPSERRLLTRLVLDIERLHQSLEGIICHGNLIHTF